MYLPSALARGEGGGGQVGQQGWRPVAVTSMLPTDSNLSTYPIQGTLEAVGASLLSGEEQAELQRVRTTLESTSQRLLSGRMTQPAPGG